MDTALYLSARRIFAPPRSKQSEVGPKRARFIITRPDLLPTEYIDQLETIINASTNTERPAPIPGTRITYE